MINVIILLGVIISLLIFVLSYNMKLSQKTQKSLFIWSMMGISFLIGYYVDISLFALFWSEATASGFSWKRLLNIIYMGALVVFLVLTAKKLKEQPVMRDVSYIVYSFSAGILFSQIMVVL